MYSIGNSIFKDEIGWLSHALRSQDLALPVDFSLYLYKEDFAHFIFAECQTKYNLFVDSLPWVKSRLEEECVKLCKKAAMHIPLQDEEYQSFISLYSSNDDLSIESSKAIQDQIKSPVHNGFVIVKKLLNFEESIKSLSEMFSLIIFQYEGKRYLLIHLQEKTLEELNLQKNSAQEAILNLSMKNNYLVINREETNRFYFRNLCPAKIAPAFLKEVSHCEID